MIQADSPAPVDASALAGDIEEDTNVFDEYLGAEMVIDAAEHDIVSVIKDSGPEGEAGEICVRAPLVMEGYNGLPEQTAEAFAGDWLHTGDVGRMDEEGYFRITGRLKDMVISGGENVYPAEVEKVILQHPAVEQTVVIGVPDPKWKEGIKAVCVLAEGQQLSDKALIEFVGSRIARYKKPQYVQFVESLPEKNGTIDRAAVKALYGE